VTHCHGQVNMERSSEKEYVDHVGVAGSDDAEAPVDKAGAVQVADFGFTPEEQRKIISRVDRRLVVTVGAMYCVSLMDRTNLGATNIAGMGVDLKLIGTRYVSRVSFCRARMGEKHGLLTWKCCLVHHNTRLLRHLHLLPTALDRLGPQNGTEVTPFRDHSALGFRHDRDGFREDLGSDGSDESHLGYNGGRLLPQLCLSA
jgi:hypothetical protein